MVSVAQGQARYTSTHSLSAPAMGTAISASMASTGIRKFRSAVTRYTAFSRKMDSRSFSDSITPMMMSDSGVIMLPTLLTTVCTGPGQWIPIASMASSPKVATVGTVRMALRLIFPPVNRGSCTVKNSTLKAISAAQL